MYRIVVVDDELWFRQGIRETIQWKDYDIEIAGEASDGEEALEVIERERPDIVFADVRMPVMDGLELSSVLASEYPDIKVVIVSGYEEFEYARKAMSLGVTHYLTKPVDAEQLIEVVNKLKEDIRKQREDRINREKIEKQLTESLPLLKEKFFNTLITGELRSVPEIKEKLEFLNIKLELQKFLVFLIDIEYVEGLFSSQYEKNRQMIRLSLLNTLQEIIKDENIIAFNGNRDYIAGLATYNLAMDSQIINNQISRLFAIFKSQVQKQLKLSITVGISRVGTDWSKVSEFYREAEEAAKHKLFLGKDQIIFYQDITINKSENEFFVFSGRDEMLDALKLCDIEKVREIFARNFEEIIKKTYLSVDQIQQAYFPVLVEIINMASITGESVEKLYDSNPFKKFMQLTTLEEINQWMVDLCEKVSELIKELRYQQNIKAVEKVIGYIYNNYNRDISLNSAAEYVFLSPAYLSRLFRKETGQSFIEYVMKVRVEKAKTLLRNTDKKTYEIAREVGYNDIRYFAKMFKQIEGITPAQYREKIC